MIKTNPVSEEELRELGELLTAIHLWTGKIEGPVSEDPFAKKLLAWTKKKGNRVNAIVEEYSRRHNLPLPILYARRY